MQGVGVLRVPRRSVVLMLFAVGTQMTVLGALAPVLPLYVVSQGAGPAQWGLMGAGAGLLMIFSEPVWGWLADRLGIRRPYWIGRVGLAIGLWLLVWWPGLLAVVLYQLVTGLFEPTSGVLARGYMVRAYTPSRQMFGLSVHLVVASVCLAIGSTTGGWLYQHVGPQSVFVLVASLGTLGILAALLPVEPPPFPAMPSSSSGRQTGWLGYLNQGTVIIGMVAVVQFLSNRLVRSFLVLLARDRAGLDASSAGVLFAIFSLANVAFLMLFNRLDRRMSLTTRVAVGLALGAAAMALYSLARSFGGLTAAVTVDALGWSLASPARIVMVGRFCEPGSYGRSLGLHGAFENVGLLLGPALGGLLWASVGPPAAYRVAALLMGIGAVAALRLRIPLATRRDAEKRTEAG